MLVKEVEKVLKKSSLKNDSLENALKKYYMLTNTGKLTPRGNRLATLDEKINNNISFNCSK